MVTWSFAGRTRLSNCKSPTPRTRRRRELFRAACRTSARSRWPFGISEWIRGVDCTGDWRGPGYIPPSPAACRRARPGASDPPRSRSVARRSDIMSTEVLVPSHAPGTRRRVRTPWSSASSGRSRSRSTTGRSSWGTQAAGGARPPDPAGESPCPHRPVDRRPVGGSAARDGQEHPADVRVPAAAGARIDSRRTALRGCTHRLIWWVLDQLASTTQADFPWAAREVSERRGIVHYIAKRWARRATRAPGGPDGQTRS